MSEFKDNQFPDNRRNDNLNHDNTGAETNQENKMPDYSFWAEQMQSPSYPYYNQGSNNWQNNNINQGTPVYTMNKKKSGGRFFSFVLKAICFGIIAALTFIGCQEIYHVINPNAPTNNLISSVNKLSDNNTFQVGFTKQTNVSTQDTNSISKVSSETLPAIVAINSTETQSNGWFGGQEVQGSGSGIIVAKNNKELLIATNNHVVEGASKISVTFIDGSVAQAEIKGADAVADLAVITVDVKSIKSSTQEAIKVTKLGNSDSVKVGEIAVAIGNSLGYGQSVTVGYISAKDRAVDVSDGYNSKKMTLLQTDAAINPGNSGGALLNIKGEVIGINTVKYASNEVEGMGYAIPISKATPIINELMSREILLENEKGYIGITGFDVTEPDSKAYNIPIGVYISEVTKDGAASKAGLKKEDIITKINELDVTSITQLRDKVNSMKVGTEVEVTYMRNTDGKYTEAKIKLILGKNPQLEQGINQ